MVSRASTSPPSERVLDAAEGLFRDGSIDAVGVDTISAHSGVSKSTLYRHFPSKAELVAAYLRRGHERRLQQWMDAIAATDGGPEDRMLGVFDWLEDWFASDGFRGCRFINAAVQLSDPEHPAHDIPGRHKEAVRQLFVDLAREATMTCPDELAQELMLLIDGAVVRALLEGMPSAAARAKRLARLTITAHAQAPAHVA